MKVLFLCGIYPQPYKDEILKNSKRGYQFAAQAFQEAVVDGLVQNGVIPHVVTVPFLSTFPLGYNKPVVNYKDTYYNDVVPVKCASFINIPFLQNIRNTAEDKVFEWCSSIDGPKHIIVYALIENIMQIAIKAKKKFTNVRLTVIVPDLPEFMSSNKLYQVLGLKKRAIRYIYSNLHFFDKFILLSEAMAVPLGVKKENYAVVEGIYSSQSNNHEDYQFEQGTKNILYTGALSQKYGIITLLEAFTSIPAKEYRLTICGDGTAKDLVEQFAVADARIHFKGKVQRDLILQMQKNADLLVNPRTPEGEYTKFSFPSKTMEYFASGTPVLMYKLPGIPEEYFSYCFFIENKSADALAEKITEILLLPVEEKEKVGIAAKRFIQQRKNAKNQTKQIIDLINIK